MSYTKDRKATKPMPGVKIPTDLIIKAIKKHRGNLSRAADSIGCDRHTLRLRADKEPEINQVLESCRERFLDETEDVLQEKVLAGDTSSVIFTLKQLGAKRGYNFERDNIAESTTRGVLDFIMNQSKNPAE